MEKKFSKHVSDVLEYSKEEAHRLGNDYIGVEHLMLGLIRDNKNTAINILKNLGVNLSELRKRIESTIVTNKANTTDINDNLPIQLQATQAIKLTNLLAKSFQCNFVETEHLLLAILHDEDSIITRLLQQYDVDYKILKNEITKYNKYKNADYKESDFEKKDKDYENAIESDDLEDDEPETDRKTHKTRTDSKTGTPVLDNFGRDLTKAAMENRLDPIVGRERELERISQILSRRKKNNPVLIGEPGVGKSAIAEGLALKIVQRKVSRALFNKRVVTLDIASIVAGTKYRGQFEERMKALINELSKNKDVILFIDEIHTIVGAGSATGTLDASNIFKPALARGEIQCIGATTLDEYRKYIEKDGALERRFQKIIVDPSTTEETIQILEQIKEKYEEHHKVRYTKEALEACVWLTDRYLSDRNLPDKAIDVLDEAGAKVHISNLNAPLELINLETELEETKSQKHKLIVHQKFEEAAKYRDRERELTAKIERQKNIWEEQTNENKITVDEENVAEVVAMMTGVPVQRIAENESTRLVNMEGELQVKVIGQPDAISVITKAIRRNRAGLKDPNRPIGSFIFLGPTGVGKTHLAKMMAKYLFDSEDALIRIDMSEYMEKFAVSRLVGAPPGYVGYEEGGQLTEKVRRRPYSIILLDEIEKAHPDIFHILLQVLDDGQLTDSLGRKVDFKNSIIIMTSNIGSRQLKDFGMGVGFNTSTRQSQSNTIAQSIIENALKKSFNPEFLNRIDDVVIFESLEKNDINKIIEIELKKVFDRIKDMGFEPNITDEAMEFLREKGWDEQYGARPLKRAIQKYVEDLLAEEIIFAKVNKGDSFTIDYNKENEKMEIRK